ncbi:hypothetical protein EB796_003160 [Bugula neritina]|uniref:Uncharacterized protein n=1 Tax=Bugula neritina TaxID=10212 RepID=A0A7J7KIK1_BUGNE|nr:hypothetical protein EB796_003160 [Bugula neritina]
MSSNGDSQLLLSCRQVCSVWLDSSVCTCVHSISINNKIVITQIYTHTDRIVNCFSSWGKGHQTNSNGSNKEKNLHGDFL